MNRNCLFLQLVFFVAVVSFTMAAPASATEIQVQAAVAPPVGTITRPELKACAVEIREQLRYHGYRLAVQGDVRAALLDAGVHGKPTTTQLAEAATTLESELIVVTVVSDDSSGEHYLDMAVQNVRTGNVRAVRAKLPFRGAAFYESKHLLPAVAAATAALVDARPHPMHGPFPETVPLNPDRLIRRDGSAVVVVGTVPMTVELPPSAFSEATPSVGAGAEAAAVAVPKPVEPTEKPKDASTSAESAKAPEPAVSAKAKPKAEASAESSVSEASKKSGKRNKKDEADESEKTKKKKKKHDWKRWDHAGLFGELGFLFSWCNRDGMCESTGKGYGARFRFGVRIASYVSLSFSAVAVDHQMPITTDTEVFLNVAQAFVYAGVFGGLRVHPVRRFPIDPYVGIDFGYSWLLYAQNTSLDVEIDPNLPEAVAEQVASLVNVRRETIYLKGFTITPEIGVNFFVAPALAFGVHAQWIIPFWKELCSRVYNPAEQGLETASQICAKADSAAGTEGFDETTNALVSSEDNLPRFVSLELDLTFVFK